MGHTLLKRCPWVAKPWQTASSHRPQRSQRPTRYRFRTHLTSWELTCSRHRSTPKTTMWFCFCCSHQTSGVGSPVSLLCWRQVSKPSLQETLHLVLGMLATATSAWTRPRPPWQAPLYRLREVEEHLTAPDLGLLFPRIQATLVAG